MSDRHSTLPVNRASDEILARITDYDFDDGSLGFVNDSWVFPRISGSRVNHESTRGTLVRFGRDEVYSKARLIFEFLGFDVAGQVVHHMNNDPFDDRWENLLLMPQGLHTFYHQRVRQGLIIPPDDWVENRVEVFDSQLILPLGGCS